MRRNLSQNVPSLPYRVSSPFFTIFPPEIRRIIYGHVYGGNLIILLHSDNRLYHRHYPLQCNPASASLSHIFRCDRPLEQWIAAIYAQTGNPKSRLDSQISLSLLQTCHAVYAEAIPILYSSNCFVVLSPLVLLDFHNCGIRPQHFALIRHLQLYDLHICPFQKFSLGIPCPQTGWDIWAGFWGTVRTMQLESLSVWMDDWFTYGTRSYVNPMLAVHGLKHAEVKYEWGHPSQPRGQIGSRRQPRLEEEIVTEWTRQSEDRLTES